MNKWKGDVAFLLVVGIVIGVWVSLYPHPGDSLLSPITPPPELNILPLTYASFSGEELAYRLYEPAGETRYVLIFLHDTLLHSGWYAELGRELAAKGVAVFLPDRRGWGHSSGDHRSTVQHRDLLLDDITAMMTVAQVRYPQRQVFLGGHGRGAGLAVRYVASQKPVSGLVLISPYLAEQQPNLDLEGWQTLVRAHPGEAFLARTGLYDWPVWHYNWPQSMVDADPLLETRYALSWGKKTMLQDPSASCAAISVPLLCVQGQSDPLFDADKTQEWMDTWAISDQKLETLIGVDYLGVLGEAAHPIAFWLAGR